MPALDLAGDYGADVRPARVGSGRKAWAKDPSGPEASDGTRLDATFVNDLVGMIRAAATAYSVTQTPGDDDLLTAILAAAIATRAPLASPALTGVPTAPTAALGTNTTQIATMAAVQAEVAALINSAPGALNTLDELAAALGDDASFAATLTTALAGKQPLDATLTSLAALGTAADKVAYTTGVDTWAEAAITAAGRSMIAAANAAAQTALLDAVTSGAKGLAPASGGGTTNFLRADGTWVAPAGSAFTGGVLSSALGIIAGTEAAPGLYFAGDTDTGLHSPAANVFGIVTQGALRWKVDASGNLLAEDHGAYDIGSSGSTNRPRNVYLSGVLYANTLSASNHYFGSGAVIQSAVDGIFTFYNNAGTGVDRLQMGGTTASFPSLKRSSATLQARLADDSAFAELKASVLEAGTSVRFPDATTQTTAAVSTAVLLGSWDYSSAVAQVEVTFAADTYAMIVVEAEGLSPSAGAYLQASIRNAGGAILTLTHANANAGAGSYAGALAQFQVGRTGSKYCSGVLHYLENANTETSMGCASNATSADRVRIAWSAGNIDAGSIRVYGLKAA